MSKPKVQITITEDEGGEATFGFEFDPPFNSEDVDANPQIHLVALTMFNDFKSNYIDKDN